MIPSADAAEVTLTHDLYTPAAIEKTLVAFHHLCTVAVTVDGQATRVRFDLNAAGPSTVRDDFLNYALELSAQELLSGGA